MNLPELKEQLSGISAAARLKKLTSFFPGKIIFTTSLGLEDQVITHEIFSNNLDIKVITLDTGRLFPETYDVLSKTQMIYKKKIHLYFPDYNAIEKLVTEKGPYSFYESKENRLECCKLRKVEPLNRALSEAECWVSGIRASQSDNRKQMDWIEYDEDKKLFKFYPIFDWSFEDVKKFIANYNVPYNDLHDKGFVSIGCQPCTKAVKIGEDFRAGRWWWENEGPKECGCHIK